MSERQQGTSTGTSIAKYRTCNKFESSHTDHGKSIRKLATELVLKTGEALKALGSSTLSLSVALQEEKFLP